MTYLIHPITFGAKAKSKASHKAGNRNASEPPEVRIAKKQLEKLRREQPGKSSAYLDYFRKPETCTVNPEEEDNIINGHRKNLTRYLTATTPEDFQPSNGKALVGALIARGVDLAQLTSGTTLLHFFSNLGFYKMVRYILEKTGNAEVKDSAGMTAKEKLAKKIERLDFDAANAQKNGVPQKMLANALALMEACKRTMAVFEDFERAQGDVKAFKKEYEQKKKQLRAKTEAQLFETDKTTKRTKADKRQAKAEREKAQEAELARILAQPHPKESRYIMRYDDFGYDGNGIYQPTGVYQPESNDYRNMRKDHLPKYYKLASSKD